MEKDKRDKDTITYQDSITAPLDCSFDDGSADADEDDEGDKENENSGSLMTSAIWRVSTSVVLVPNNSYSCKLSAPCYSPCDMIQSPTASVAVAIPDVF